MTSESTFSSEIATALDAQRIYRRVCVRTPYFALTDLQVQGAGEITCTVPVEQKPDREQTLINLAEGGRHLAILGSCAVASVAPDDRRRYYLAQTAAIRWQHREALNTSERLVGYASGGFSSARNAFANATVRTQRGTPIAQYDFTYAVVSEGAFQRIFAHAKRDGATSVLNPYTAPLALTEVRGDNQTLSATVVADIADCAGHFVDYPTLPVAVLGGCMVDAAAQLLDNITGQSRTPWITRSADLNATQLVSSGQRLTLTASRGEVTADEATISITANLRESSVADLTLRLAQL